MHIHYLREILADGQVNMNHHEEQEYPGYDVMDHAGHNLIVKPAVVHPAYPGSIRIVQREPGQYLEDDHQENN